MRSISRVADVSINTVSKLLVEAGEAALLIHDETVACNGGGDHRSPVVAGRHLRQDRRDGTGSGEARALQETATIVE